MRQLVIMVVLAGCACASARDYAVRPRLPTPLEVASYVERTWRSDGWDMLLARSASRPGEIATLVAVDNVRCSYYYDNPDCTFDVTGRFPPGESVTRNFSSSFEWRDGQLVGVILSVHTRPVS